jgi:hypothetical protein
VAGNELVGGLEKKAHVLSFQVSDAQAILLFEPAGRGPSDLAIPAGALAVPFHNMARRGLSMRSTVAFGTRSAPMAYTSFRDMTALVSMRCHPLVSV